MRLYSETCEDLQARKMGVALKSSVHAAPDARELPRALNGKPEHPNSIQKL